MVSLGSHFFGIHDSSRKNFRIFLAVSLAAHFLCFLFIIITPGQFFSKEIKIVPSVRVDAVGLPDIQRPAQEKVKKKAAPPRSVLKKKSPPKKKKKPKEPKKLKEPKEPKKAKSEPPPKEKPIQNLEAQAQAFEKLKATPDSPIKGEKISQGDSDQGEVDQLLIYSYFTQVKSHIKRYWNLPKILADKNLKATALIQINRHGEVMRIEFEKPSGDPAFDQIVIETIRGASPFPPPPDDIKSFLKGGIGLNFPY